MRQTEVNPFEERGRSKSAWQIFATTWTAISLPLVILGLAVGPCAMHRGKEEGRASIEELLKRSSSGNYGDPVGEGLASDTVQKWLRERDAQWGPAQKYSVEGQIVQLGGTPSEVTVHVWRKRRNVVERYTTSGRKVVFAAVAWPAAEEK
jgi:hypothetical protein